MDNASIKNEISFVMMLSLVCALLLGGTRLAIGERAELSDATVSAVWDILGRDKADKGAYRAFLEEFSQIKKSNKLRLWQHSTDKAIWACEATGSGMWNEITAVFIIDVNKKQILGLRITEQNETAGLGSEISSESFCEQFVLKSFSEFATDPNTKLEIDAITGATTSSRSVERLLNRALLGMLPLCNGGQNE